MFGGGATRPFGVAPELLGRKGDVTASAVGVAHVVGGAVAAVVGVGGGGVDSHVLTPVHLRQGWGHTLAPPPTGRRPLLPSLWSPDFEGRLVS